MLYFENIFYYLVSGAVVPHVRKVLHFKLVIRGLCYIVANSLRQCHILPYWQLLELNFALTESFFPCRHPSTKFGAIPIVRSSYVDPKRRHKFASKVGSWLLVFYAKSRLGRLQQCHTLPYRQRLELNFTFPESVFPGRHPLTKFGTIPV